MINNKKPSTLEEWQDYFEEEGWKALGYPSKKK